MGLVRDSRAGRFRLGEQLIDLVLALDKVPDGELPTLRRSEWDVGVLGEFGARVESQDETVIKVEHHDGTSRSCAVPAELGADHAG